MPEIAKSNEVIISERTWLIDPMDCLSIFVGIEASCGVKKINESPSNSMIGVNLVIDSSRKKLLLHRGITILDAKSDMREC